MTENQWPQNGSYGTLGDTRQTAVPNNADYPPPLTPDSPTKTETAQHEAGDVAHQATEAAQHVEETAKAEAANVAGEVKASAEDLLHMARSDLRDQAEMQQQKVAHGLHSISGELRTMAAAAGQPGVATDLVRQAADRSGAVASWLEGRDPGSLLNEVKTFARQRPGTFLLLAAGAGILAGRLTRSLSEGAPDNQAARAAGEGAERAPIPVVPDAGASGSYQTGAGTAVPPPPVQLPGPDATTAGMAGPDASAGSYAGAPTTHPADLYPPTPSADEGTHQGEERSGDQVAGPGIPEVPEVPPAGSRPDDDPYREDPLRGGRL